MIIYGTKAVHLKTVESQTATCPNCGTQGSLRFSVFKEHIHVFWVPLFPFSKKGVSECQHCKNVLKPKEMPDPIKREYQNLKDQSKGPAWQFAGLGVLAILMAWGGYASGEEKKLELEYLKSPQIGDIYEYEIETGSYSTLKVVDVSDDSVFVSPNDYEINKRTKIYKIDKSENYSDSILYGLSNSMIREMYDSGEIFDINR